MGWEIESWGGRLGHGVGDWVMEWVIASWGG